MEQVSRLDRRILDLADLMRKRIDILQEPRMEQNRWWNKELLTADGIAVHDNGSVKVVRNSQALLSIDQRTLPYEEGFGITSSQFAAIPSPSLSIEEAWAFVDNKYSALLLNAVSDQSLLEEYMGAILLYSGFPSAPLTDAVLSVRIPERTELPRIYPLGLGNSNSFYNVMIRDITCLLYTSPSPRDRTRSRMPSSA